MTGSESNNVTTNWHSQKMKLVFPDFKTLSNICYCISLNAHILLAPKSQLHFKIKLKVRK